MRPSAPALVLAVTLAAAPAVPAARAPARATPARFELGPPPAWVEPLALPERPAAAEGAGGVEYLLVDDQLRPAASGSPLEHHRRVVMRVGSTAGVEEASEVRVDFDPGYQRLVLHGAWIVRGGQRRPVLRPGDVRVIQRETDLDRQLFDGTHTAVLFLPDVRAGDVVEYAYTLRGQNPVLGGHFADELPLAWGVPVARLRVRLLWPAGRPLRQRVTGIALPPEVRARQGHALTELVWERHGVAAVDEEDRAPPGADPAPALELTDFEGWGEVVRWALPLYPDAPLTAAMQAEVDRWRALPTAAERARAALRFVEDEVRYLGLEEGERSHRPHAPAEVFARRYGDCKDKAYLLVTLLRALGVPAAPALVDTERQGAVADHLPSPYQFDHVVVRAEVDGAVRWLEPTRSLEHAPLAGLVPPTYGVALPIAPGVEALTPLPPRPEATARAVTTFRLARFDAPASLEVTTTFTGLRALAMRQALAGEGKDERQDAYLQHYAQLYPGLSKDGPLEVEDAPAEDRVTVRERYRLPPAAEGAEQEFTADLLAGELELPRTTVRTLPLQVAHPVAVEEEIRIELPGVPDAGPDRRQVRTPAAHLDRTIAVEGHALVARYAYRSVAAAAPPAALAQHLAGVRAMRQLAGFTVTLAVKGDGAAEAEPEPAGAGWSTGALVALVLGFLVLGLGLVVLLLGFLAWSAWRVPLRDRVAAWLGNPPSPPA